MSEKETVQPREDPLSAGGASSQRSSGGKGDWRRRLPAVGRLMNQGAIAQLIELYGREQVLVQVQLQVEQLRHWGESHGEMPDDRVAALPGKVEEALAAARRPPLRRVINATGIFLHTNLGRSPLPREVIERQATLLDAYCDLEFDLESGRRGDRTARVEELIEAITGADRGLVVNNNAAALILVLHTLARGREVVVSRGELVEIGGSFRIPDILEAAGAELVEVGTTNKTRLSDYGAALSENTGLLLKVHPSNYKIRGFVEEVSAADLAGLSTQRGVPFLMDEGSGLLLPSRVPQLAGHPSFQELLGSGVDLVCGSGDKLLGGPQAGLLAGRSDLLERCRKNPLYRALRTDRATLAALEGVLRMHLAGARLPLERLFAPPQESLPRLEAVARRLGGRIVDAEAYLGGGAAPDAPISGQALALAGGEELKRRLRLGSTPVVGYSRGDRLILDLRTVDPVDDDRLVAAVRDAAAGDDAR